MVCLCILEFTTIAIQSTRRFGEKANFESVSSLFLQFDKFVWCVKKAPFFMKVNVKDWSQKYTHRREEKTCRTLSTPGTQGSRSHQIINCVVPSKSALDHVRTTLAVNFHMYVYNIYHMRWSCISYTIYVISYVYTSYEYIYLYVYTEWRTKCHAI